MNKFTKKAMAALVLGLGLLTACTSNDEPNGNGSVVEGSTYMSVAINLSTANSTRADNQEDENGNPDYNNVGKWAGQDKIENIDVYVFNNANVLEAYETFSATQFQVQAADADKSVKVTPSKGIKVEPGMKKVYVVVNAKQVTRDFLPAVKNTTTLADFQKKYENVADAPADFFDLENSGTTHPAVSTSAAKLAEVNGENKDVITMTAVKVAEVDVKENVSEPTTLQDATNRASLTVKRAVARVMVTTTNATFEVKGDDPLTPNVKEDMVLGTISDIKYVVGQGGKSMYFMQRAGGDADLTYKTPYSAFLPTDAAKNYEWGTVSKQYDYSGLWKGYNPAGISGVDVPTAALYDQNAGTALDNISKDLKAKLSGEFILPNTHKYGNTQDLSGYRKGNTAYVLVRAKFTPKRVVMENGTINEAWVAGTTFYLGANGVFYETVKAAREAKAADGTMLGVAGQTAAKYENGKTLYFAWINPDKTKGWLNSPVNRNNIYHIEISGFKRIGANWNPLVPPVDPNDPDGPNPNNPDPKPQDPNEPDTPPVDPNDPLTPKETWMSVDTKILPWNVHSYSVVLDI